VAGLLNAHPSLSAEVQDKHSALEVAFGRTA
jgi:hypothetical protein